MDTYAPAFSAGCETRGYGYTPLTPPPDWRSTPYSSDSFGYHNPSLQSRPWSLSTPPWTAYSSYLPSPSPQQEPGSTEYLNRLFRLARFLSAPTERPPMADFLANFNFHEQPSSQPDTRSCSSIEELQSRLGDVLSTRITPTRAQHVATTLDLGGTARLMLEADSDALEGLNNIDPLLGGLGSLSETLRGPEDSVRVVLASDALTNQPQDNPVLQRSVAKAIINALGALDGSDWTVKGLSRGAQGWTFMYICKGSFQHWNRQNKAQAKPLIADYSQRELDPQLSARPAFDCRGCITISFSRGSRTISIKYDHTPLHKTVAELAAFFKPPPPESPVPVADKQKTPKKTPSAKKKRDGDETPNGTGTAKKRKRKTGDGTVQPDASEAGPSTGLSQSDDVANAAVEQSTAESDAQNGVSMVNGAASAQTTVGGTLALNVTPEEATRRRNVASIMLRESGVDPETLSTEQFNIFANQSPELQKESLNMLVKYGAERLRIVHPGHREGSAPTSSGILTTPVQPGSIQTSPSGPVTTRELALQTQGTTAGSDKENQPAGGSKGNAAADHETENETETPSKARQRVKKSRVACVRCKNRRVKCPRELPTCAGCETAGLACEYAARKPRKTKSNAVVATGEDPQENNAEETDAEYEEMQDHSVQAPMPVADMLTTNMSTNDWATDDSQAHYYQTAGSMAVPETNSPQPLQQTHDSTSNLILSKKRMYYPQPVATVEMQEPRQTQTISPRQTRASLRGSSRERRQPLPNAPNGQPQRDSQQSPVTQHSTTTSDWHAINNPVTQVTQAATITVMNTAIPDQTSGDHNYGMGVEPGRPHQGIWRAAALSQAALSQKPMEDSQQSSMAVTQQQQMVTAPIQRHSTASPMMEPLRTRSRRTGHNTRASFNDTQVAETLQTPAVPDQHSTAHVSLQQTQTNMNTTTSYNNYDRYSDTRSTNTTNVSSTGRIAYEPYSYQRDATNSNSYASYGQTTHVTTAAAMSSIPATAMASSEQPNTRMYNQYSNSQSHTTPHSSAPAYSTRSATQETSPEHSYNTRQSFSVRPQASTLHTSQSTMKQDQRYNSYPSQIQQQQQQQQQQRQSQLQQHGQQHTQQHTQQHAQQQANQHHGWYSFNNQGNTSFGASAGHGTNYSWGLSGGS